MGAPRRRRVNFLLRAALFCTASAACLLLVGPPATAQPTSAQSGYWSQAPADPETPAGGTEIASNPSGPTAVAAYRFEVPAGESADVLTLRVAFAQPSGQVALIACPVKESSANWQPPSGAGMFSSAPASDCSGGSVAGQVATDSSKVTFDLSRLDFAGTTVNVVVGPNPTPSAAPAGPSTSYPAFEVDFQPVSAQSLTTTGTPDTGTSGAGAAGAGAGSPSAGSPFTASPAYQPASGGFGAPASPAAAAASPSALAPALASTPASGAASARPPATPATMPAQATRLTTVSPSGRSEWRWRLELALGMVLIDLFAYMWYQQRAGRPDDERPSLSIYDPPPVPSVGEGAAGGAGLA